MQNSKDIQNGRFEVWYNVQKKNGSDCAVFCFATHEVLTVQESQLELYQENFDEAVKKKKTKGVANAFSEVTTFPDIYLEKLNLDRASLTSVVDNAQKNLKICETV